MMRRLTWMIGLCIPLLGLSSFIAHAKPSDAMVKTLDSSVLRIEVNFQNGDHGYGSGVVISEDEVVTSCHVVRNGKDIQLNVGDAILHATAVKPDWKHDLCVLEVPNLNVPVIVLGESNTLHHNQAIFTIGYPGGVKSPVSTFGEVKGLFAMDGSVIVQASSAFEPGASGGGAFDDEGHLIGIITVRNKSPEQYYYVPVEWLRSLKNQPFQPLGMAAQKPFWAASEKERPYFMQIVRPVAEGQWNTLLTIASAWTEHEPESAESWFYLGLAEFKTMELSAAKLHFEKALQIESSHTQALQYLSRVSQVKQHLQQDDRVAHTSF